MLMSTSELQSPLPSGINTPQTKLVYLAVVIADGMTLTDLQRVLGLSKLSLLPILGALVAQDLVHQTEGKYVPR